MNGRFSKDDVWISRLLRAVAGVAGADRSDDAHYVVVRDFPLGLTLVAAATPADTPNLR
ncbi:MAG: hypothetical protein QNJ94_20015 [Alphaproteobacteria bacterium]|nr:hypothetical protein [Alphaproteobacteria bacterium]